jgi:uncharacterized C2H2 Zn-finger protein/uncharacterized coiled-coil protein SlyX
MMNTILRELHFSCVDAQASSKIHRRISYLEQEIAHKNMEIQELSKRGPNEVTITQMKLELFDAFVDKQKNRYQQEKKQQAKIGRSLSMPYVTNVTCNYEKHLKREETNEHASHTNDNKQDDHVAVKNGDKHNGDDQNNPLQCPKCLRIFSRNDSMLRHKKQCDGLLPTQCKTCKKHFKTTKSKFNHVKRDNCTPRYS